MDGIEPPSLRDSKTQWPAIGPHQLNVPRQRDIPDNKALFGMLPLNLKQSNGLFDSGGARPAETQFFAII